MQPQLSNISVLQALYVETLYVEANDVIVYCQLFFLCNHSILQTNKMTGGKLVIKYH